MAKPPAISEITPNNNTGACSPTTSLYQHERHSINRYARALRGKKPENLFDFREHCSRIFTPPTSKTVCGAIIEPIRPNMEAKPHNDRRNSVGNISAEYIYKILNDMVIKNLLNRKKLICKPGTSVEKEKNNYQRRI